MRGKDNRAKQPVSRVRKTYFIRLFGRIIVLFSVVAIYFFKSEWLDILHGNNFFKKLSPLHILWIIWVIDMISQLIPVRKHLPLGSGKHFKENFKPIMDKINYKALREYIISTTKSAYKVFIIWSALILVLGMLYKCSLLTESHLFLISVLFYVCDLICVLIWCPFRLIMKNRCCTTCRIFNWDHLMMFTPLLFINSFYSVSLLIMAFAVWTVWELCVMMYPERFWEQTNTALKCSECTDKLCTQYCQKLRS
ncbi:MAG: hypothetical protein PUE12_03390 [Oscillospiraceae bacterium]|nr:hypothetical protein [Oscillospiraceae bacterium]